MGRGAGLIQAAGCQSSRNRRPDIRVQLVVTSHSHVGFHSANNFFTSKRPHGLYMHRGSSEHCGGLHHKVHEHVIVFIRHCWEHVPCGHYGHLSAVAGIINIHLYRTLKTSPVFLFFRQIWDTRRNLRQTTGTNDDEPATEAHLVANLDRHFDMGLSCCCGPS